jgi:hypothetical protein
LVRNESYGRLIGDKIDLEHEASSWGGRSATGVDASFGCTLGGGRDVVPPSKRWAHENLGIKALYTLGDDEGDVVVLLVGGEGVDLSDDVVDQSA